MLPFDNVANAWVLRSPDGMPVFYFYMDGSIGFPKVHPKARLRFASDASGIEVSDGQNWRKIPFSYGQAGTATANVSSPATFAVNPGNTPIDVTIAPSTAPVGEAVKGFAPPIGPQ